MSATNKNPSTASTSTFISALVLGVATFTVYMVLFWYLHSRFRNVYQPRTLYAPPNKRPPELPAGLFGWFAAIARAPDMHIFEMNGPDAYFLVRFIRLMIKILIPTWIVTWAVILPVNAVKPNNGHTGLDQFTFGNVGQQTRKLAHMLVAIVEIVYILFLLYKEYVHFALIRQGYLGSRAHALLARSRTVMINNIPAALLSESALRALSTSPITNVWLPRQTKTLNKLYDQRNTECARLEGAEGKVMSLASKNVRKNTLPPADAEGGKGSLIARYVLAKKLPSHRIGALSKVPVLPLGKKVNTLEYSPVLIREQNEKLESHRGNYTKDEKMFPACNSAFIRFARQEEAHAFARDIKSTAGSKLIGAAVEVVPEDIIWNNLAMSPVMRKIRTIISWALTIGLIIIWAIPVAFVGVVSNIQSVCSEVSFLSWICKLPSVVVGIIQGILPPVLLAVLFMLLPIVLRMLVKFEGEPRRSDVERKLFARFWLFQVIHGFLIVTFASGLTKSLSNISKTVSTLPTQLAQNLPGASIFFLTFIVTTMFGTAGSTSARVVPLIMRKLVEKGILAGNTPRKAYAKEWGMGALALATVWPPIALLGCIVIVYSVIQPIVAGFGAVGFILIYITYKYLTMYIVDQPDALETGGLMFVMALRTVFVSLYLLEVCLAGLFFLGRDTIGYICGAIMAVMIVFTALVQIWIDRRAFPRNKYMYVGGGNPGALAQTGSAEGLQPGRPSTATAGTPNTAADVPTTAADEDAASAGAEHGNTTGLHARAFDPPSVWKSQPVVWVADDALGIGREEVKRVEAEGVKASCAYARMDEQGRLHVERGPPDEAWYGGMTKH